MHRRSSAYVRRDRPGDDNEVVVDDRPVPDELKPSEREPCLEGNEEVEETVHAWG